MSAENAQPNIDVGEAAEHSNAARAEFLKKFGLDPNTTDEELKDVMAAYEMKTAEALEPTRTKIAERELAELMDFGSPKKEEIMFGADMEEQVAETQVEQEQSDEDNCAVVFKGHTTEEGKTVAKFYDNVASEPFRYTREQCEDRARDLQQKLPDARRYGQSTVAKEIEEELEAMRSALAGWPKTAQDK